MPAEIRVEDALHAAMAPIDGVGRPPLLAEAMRHAVFPGGARIRPRLTLAVAMACGDDDPELSDAAACAIELLHCASLVHDDLPCFDDANLRRGKPSVHVQFGERLAVLAGDALITLSFETLGRAASGHLDRLPVLVSTVAGSVGMPLGICAGQAWECEPEVHIDHYHQCKTGALFAAATVSGAAAAGFPTTGWRTLGARLGAAFQVADDIRDAAGDPNLLGKPTGQDVLHGRPNAVTEDGLVGAIRRLERMVDDAADAVPACPGQSPLRRQLVAETRKFLPQGLWQLAA